MGWPWPLLPLVLLLSFQQQASGWPRRLSPPPPPPHHASPPWLPCAAVCRTTSRRPSMTASSTPPPPPSLSSSPNAPAAGTAMPRVPAAVTAAAAAPVSPKPLSPLPPLMEGDVVEYLITHRQRQKGQLPAGDRRVLGLGVVNFIGQIHPLCKRKEDDPLLYYDEEQDVLDDPLETIVTRVLERVSYSQRCIENRLINPHGEEAEDVFEIEEALSEGCGPAIRYS